MGVSINQVVIAGNLTRDPELRSLPSGQNVASFSIAVNRHFQKDGGEKVEEVSYVKIVAWAKLAEICNEYLKKGSPVLVSGRIQSRSWEAEDGSKRSATEVVASNVQFLSTGKKQEKAESTSEPKNELAPDEDIPF